MKEQINMLSAHIHNDNAIKGFWDDEKTATANASSPVLQSAIQKAFFGQRLALVSSELAEALEADRKDLMDDKLPHRKGTEVELADALIRILDMAGGYGYDIGGAVEEKLAFNRTREFKHGKAY